MPTDVSVPVNSTNVGIQAAIDNCAAGGGGRVYVPPGTYVISKTVTIKPNVTLQGAGSNVVTMKCDVHATGAPFKMFEIMGSDVTVQDIKFDGNAHTSVFLLAVGRSGVTNTFNRITIRQCDFTAATWLLIGTFPATTCNDFRLQDNLFHDSTFGVYLQPPPAGGSAGWTITGNTFRNINPTSLDNSLLLNGAATFDTFKHVLIANNIFHDNSNTLAMLEYTGCTDIVVSGNTVHSGSRGFSSGWCKRMTIAGNVLENQDVYAIELNAGNEITITGNTMMNCQSFVQPSNNTTPVTDVTISGNTIVGNGYGLNKGNSILIHNGASRWTIVGNTWRDSQSTNVDGVIRVGNADTTVSDIVITGNTYYAVDANSDVNFVTVRDSSNTVINGNTIMIERAVGPAWNTFAAIYVSTNNVNVEVNDNLIKMTGSLTAASYDGISDGHPGAYTAAGWSFRRNTIKGFNTGIWLINNGSTTLTVQGNDAGQGNGAAYNLPGTARTSVNM